LNAAEFEALYQRLQRVPAWGPDDRRGALNHLTPARGQDSRLARRSTRSRSC